ncbi:MAG: helix-turn-helix domain-containing protein [Acetatifactor sp.]|nr:helix-turn-helix domain-containing protein [Acetatifactor sp.]
MTIGERFREIRKQRKCSIAKLGDVAGSKSSISAFENNDSFITIDTLLKYMDELMITPEELLDSSLYERNNTVVDIMKDSAIAYEMRDAEKLESYAIKFERLYKDTKRYIYYIFSLNISLLSAEIDNSRMDEKKKQEMLDYFFSIRRWTILDIGLWGNVANHYNDEVVFLLALEILREISKYPQSGRERICLDSCLNSLFTLLSHHNQEYSGKLIERISEFSLPNHYLYQSIYFNLCKAMYAYRWGDRKIALAEKRKILLVIKNTFSDKEAASWNADFKKIMK